MERRDFLAHAAAVPLGPLAGHVSRTLHTRRPSSAPSPRRSSRARRRQFAILLLVIPPANWRPRTWRDIPPATSGNPFVVVDRYEPQAAGLCRSVAKLHNVGQIRDGIRTWAIVACNDGRFHQRGQRGTEGGAL